MLLPFEASGLTVGLKENESYIAINTLKLELDAIDVILPTICTTVCFEALISLFGNSIVNIGCAILMVIFQKTWSVVSAPVVMDTELPTKTNAPAPATIYRPAFNSALCPVNTNDPESDTTFLPEIKPQSRPVNVNDAWAACK